MQRCTEEVQRVLSSAKAIECIYRIITGRHSGTVMRETTINGRKALEILPADGYGRRTVICVHGMSVRGFRDPRIIHIGQTFAAMGYRSMIPSYPEIQDLCIDPTSSDRIADDIRKLAGESGYPVGLFTASFSGGLSLIAASKPAVAHLVSALLVVGTYAHVDTALDFFLHRETADPYGLFIILKNFLPFLNEPEALLKAFDTAAKDDGFRRVEKELGPYLESQPEEIRELYRRYMEDRAFRLEQWKKISNMPEAQHIFERMDVLRVAGGLKAAICLLHGAEDNVIPPAESLLLKKKLENQVPVSLTITSIIDHGNVKAGLSMAREIVSLVQTMALFFRHLDGSKYPIGRNFQII